MEDEKDKNQEFEQSVVKIVIAELIERGFISKNINTFERTKEVLRKYKRIKHSISGINKQINNLEKNLETISGIKPGMKKAGISLLNDSNSNPTDYDGIYSRINELESSKVKLNVFLDYIKLLVEENASDDDKDLFNRLFFDTNEKASVKDICDELDCNSITIYRRINNVVNKIYIELFPDLYLDEICNRWFLWKNHDNNMLFTM